MKYVILLFFLFQQGCGHFSHRKLSSDEKNYKIDVNYGSLTFTLYEKKLNQWSQSPIEGQKEFLKFLNNVKAEVKSLLAATDEDAIEYENFENLLNFVEKEIDYHQKFKKFQHDRAQTLPERLNKKVKPGVKTIILLSVVAVSLIILLAYFNLNFSRPKPAEIKRYPISRETLFWRNTLVVVNDDNRFYEARTIALVTDFFKNEMKYDISNLRLFYSGLREVTFVRHVGKKKTNKYDHIYIGISGDKKEARIHVFDGKLKQRFSKYLFKSKINVDEIFYDLYYDQFDAVFDGRVGDFVDISERGAYTILIKDTSKIKMK